MDLENNDTDYGRGGGAEWHVHCVVPARDQFIINLTLALLSA